MPTVNLEQSDWDTARDIQAQIWEKKRRKVKLKTIVAEALKQLGQSPERLNITDTGAKHE